KSCAHETMCCHPKAWSKQELNAKTESRQEETNTYTIAQRVPNPLIRFVKRMLFPHACGKAIEQYCGNASHYRPVQTKDDNTDSSLKWISPKQIPKTYSCRTQETKNCTIA